MSTTAGGDGLEFDQRLPSIFDEIMTIKGDGSQTQKKKTTRNDDEGLTLDLVASQPSLNPLSVLLQVVDNLEAF
jgi:hypothetical protein